MSFADSEVYKLNEIVILLDRFARLVLLAPYKITFNEFLVMMVARERSRPSQTEVVESLDTSKSLVSQRVRSLVGKGLIAQTYDPGSRREVHLDLTARGAKLLDEVYGTLLASADSLFALLGGRRREFGECLSDLLEALRADSALPTREPPEV